MNDLPPPSEPALRRLLRFDKQIAGMALMPIVIPVAILIALVLLFTGLYFFAWRG
jgi:hypothetical protein